MLMRMMPLDVMVPTTGGLTLTLPASGLTEKAHNPFGQVITIAGIKDEVVIMSSLQRPKKVCCPKGTSFLHMCHILNLIRKLCWRTLAQSAVSKDGHLVDMRCKQCHLWERTCMWLILFLACLGSCCFCANLLTCCTQITLIGSDGRQYTFLAKPKDDLRKDHRMMEVAGVINRLFAREPSSRRRNLYLRRCAAHPSHTTASS